MEGKNIFIVTQERQMCGETYCSTIAAFHNEEDAKKKMKEVSKADISYFNEHINKGGIDKHDIDVEENENSIFISVNHRGEYSYIEIKQATLY